MTRTKLAAIAALSVCAAAPTLAARTTWSIDQPWEFYTAGTPDGTDLTNLVGTITWDTDVSTYYPAEWSFTLSHFDPVFGAAFPLTIEGVYPNVSDAAGLAWSFSRDPFTVVVLNFGSAPGTLDVLVNGTQVSVTFAAAEYVQVGPFSSQRLIYTGTMTLVPAPGAAAALALAGLGASRRRR